MRFTIFRLGLALWLVLACATPRSFAASTYPASAGIYNTLISSSNAAFAQSGSILLAISHTGALTGKLSVGNNAYPLRAVLNDNAALIQIPNAPVAMTIGLTLDPATPSVTGTLLGPGWSVPFSASRVPYTPLKPTPQAGRYTLLFSATQSGSNAQGYGSATMLVTPAGLITINGHTPTGAPFTTAAYLNAGSTFPFYTATRGPQPASVSGSVQFTTITGVCDCDGTLASSGPSSPLSLIGSRYAAPPFDGIALPFSTAGKDNCDLDFGQGNVAFTSIPVTLISNRILSSTAHVSNLAINRQTGAFSGRLTFSGSGGPFFGVAFQDQALGAGVLINSQTPGWVLLQSPSASVSNPSTQSADSTIGVSGGSIIVSGALSGSETLSGANSYTGNTFINGGTLQVAGNLSGSAALALNSTGTLEIDSPVMNVGATITVGMPNSSNSIVIAGEVTSTISSGLTKTGSGTLTLSGSNILIGAATANAGTLTLNSGGTLTLNGVADGLGSTIATLGSTAGITDSELESSVSVEIDSGTLMASQAAFEIYYQAVIQAAFNPPATTGTAYGYIWTTGTGITPEESPFADM